MGGTEQLMHRRGLRKSPGFHPPPLDGPVQDEEEGTRPKGKAGIQAEKSCLCPCLCHGQGAAAS